MNKEDVIEYNREMKEFLTEVWNSLPKGRQKQFIKDQRKKALLDRYKVPYEDSPESLGNTDR